MTKIVNRGSFLTVQLDSGYPKYFGYNPHFGGINEPGADINKLYAMLSLILTGSKYNVESE